MENFENILFRNRLVLVLVLVWFHLGLVWVVWFFFLKNSFIFIIVISSNSAKYSDKCDKHSNKHIDSIHTNKVLWKHL